MSDFWSGMFLLGTIVVGIFLGTIALFVALLGNKKTYLYRVFFVIVFALISIWIIDRFIAGAFCFLWECIDRNINIETLLLNDTDLPDEWAVESTFDYAYVPRASSAYVERVFHSSAASINNDFYEEIYQYRSIRGASYQYDELKKEFPTLYSIHSVSISTQFNLQVSYASEYDFGCLYDMKNSTCYYLARYNEYVLLLRMPFSGDVIVDDDFVKVVKLADEKFSSSLGNSVMPLL